MWGWRGSRSSARKPQRGWPPVAVRSLWPFDHCSAITGRRCIIDSSLQWSSCSVISPSIIVGMCNARSVDIKLSGISIWIADERLWLAAVVEAWYDRHYSLSLITRSPAGCDFIKAYNYRCPQTSHGNVPLFQWRALHFDEYQFREYVSAVVLTIGTGWWSSSPVERFFFLTLVISNKSITISETRSNECWGSLRFSYLMINIHVTGTSSTTVCRAVITLSTFTCWPHTNRLSLAAEPLADACYIGSRLGVATRPIVLLSC